MASAKEEIASDPITADFVRDGQVRLEFILEGGDDVISSWYLAARKEADRMVKVGRTTRSADEITEAIMGLVLSA